MREAYSHKDNVLDFVNERKLQTAEKAEQYFCINFEVIGLLL